MEQVPAGDLPVATVKLQAAQFIESVRTRVFIAREKEKQSQCLEVFD